MLQSKSSIEKKSATLRGTAHQLLNKEEREILKHVMRTYRTTSSLDIMCSSLSKFIRSPEKIEIISIISEMFPEDLSKEFLRRCEITIPVYSMMLKFPMCSKSTESSSVTSELKLSHSLHSINTTTKSSISTVPNPQRACATVNPRINYKRRRSNESETLLKRLSESCKNREATLADKIDDQILKARPALSSLKDFGFWQNLNKKHPSDTDSDSSIAANHSGKPENGSNCPDERQTSNQPIHSVNSSFSKRSMNEKRGLFLRFSLTSDSIDENYSIQSMNNETQKSDPEVTRSSTVSLSSCSNSDTGNNLSHTAKSSSCRSANSHKNKNKSSRDLEFFENNRISRISTISAHRLEQRDRTIISPKLPLFTTATIDENDQNEESHSFVRENPFIFGLKDSCSDGCLAKNFRYAAKLSPNQLELVPDHELEMKEEFFHEWNPQCQEEFIEESLLHFVNYEMTQTRFSDSIANHIATSAQRFCLIMDDDLMESLTVTFIDFYEDRNYCEFEKYADSSIQFTQENTFLNRFYLGDYCGYIVYLPEERMENVCVSTVHHDNRILTDFRECVQMLSVTVTPSGWEHKQIQTDIKDLQDTCTQTNGEDVYAEACSQTDGFS